MDGSRVMAWLQIIFTQNFVIQRFGQGMQILSNCETERKHRSVQNEQQGDLSPLLSRSNTLHEGDLRLKLKQKMRRDLSALSAELIQLSPSSDKDSLNEPENDRHTINKLQLQPPQSSLPPKTNPEKPKPWAKTVIFQQPYALNIPVQLIFEEQVQEEDCLNNTGEIMDHKFDRILELNCNTHGMDILEIQSQFTVVKSYRHLSEPEFLEPDVKEPVQPHNIHEKLLEEENHYLREQLIEFTHFIDSNKQCLQQLSHKYRRIKRESHKITQQTNKLQEIIRILGEDLNKKDAFISQLHQIIEENSKHLNQLLKQRQFNEIQIERLEKNCLDFEEKLQNYELKREGEIESIQEEKLKLRQYYEDLLAEKEKEMAELNDFILQIRSQQHRGDPQGNHKRGEDNVMQTSSFEELESSKIFQNAANSICLSLADAESLKNIIEEKEELHKAQLLLMKQGFIQKEQEIERNIEQIKLKLAEVERVNHTLAFENDSKQRKIDHLEHILSNLECADGAEQDWNGAQELLRAGYSRRVKKLEKRMVDAREEKMQLLGKINELEQRFLNGEKEDDDQLEELLENCVNELEKEREITYILRNQNDYYKQLLCKQQMLATNLPIYN